MAQPGSKLGLFGSRVQTFNHFLTSADPRRMPGLNFKTHKIIKQEDCNDLKQKQRHIAAYTFLTLFTDPTSALPHPNANFFRETSIFHHIICTYRKEITN
jgi:hypothetical protein